MLAIAGLLTIGGALYAFTPKSDTCPLEGTPACPKVKCELKGAECTLGCCKM